MLAGALTIDNSKAGFLTRNFAFEYSALFDGLLPFLSYEGLPIPLGGTSNHFRTNLLKKAGGWDPYNVTEDADLGLRLTRLGYRIDILSTETWEEAPENYPAWMRQRSRWFKGWMQTWLVHMRRPRALLRELGISGFLTFHILIGGMLVSSLIHPIFIITFVTTITAILIKHDVNMLPFWYLSIANGINLLTGYACAMTLAYRTARLRHGCKWWQILDLPLYWLLMTPAAWRALFHLIKQPHHWEKTTHGQSNDRPPLTNPINQAQQWS